jgi:glutamyl-tRNA synthetase
MLSMRLTLRTYLVGHQVTLADFGIWGHLKGNGVAMGLLKGFGHVLRW